MTNGRYSVRVSASDAQSNSPATALVGTMESTAFEIDNAPPSIAGTAVRRETIIAFDVRDDHSSVQKADYSLDGDRWMTIYPRDGIADSRVGQYELVLEGRCGRARRHPAGHRRAQERQQHSRRSRSAFRPPLRIGASTSGGCPRLPARRRAPAAAAPAGAEP